MSKIESTITIDNHIDMNIFTQCGISKKYVMEQPVPFSLIVARKIGDQEL